MKAFLHIFTLLVFCTIATNAQTQNVTFQVENPTSTPVYVFGSWTNWSNWPGTPMTMVAPGKYSATIAMPPSATYEFLYVRDSSGNNVKEQLNSTWSCTNGNVQYTNRVFNLGTADTGICYTWQTCNTCTITPPPPPPTPVNVTFQVESPDSTPVSIIGSWNWSNFPGASMSMIAPNKYTVTMPLPPNTTYEFKFVNGATPTLETLDPAWPCTNGNQQYTNHVLNLGGNDTAICYTWSSCNTCTVTPPPTDVDVTFQVENTDSTPVYLFGSWNNWSNFPGAQMTSVGGNRYELVVPLSPNATYEFKYVNGNTPTFETLDPAWLCTNGNQQYTNRVLNLAGADTTVCTNWASCVTCVPPPPPVNITFQVHRPDSMPVYVFGSWSNWTNFPGYPMAYNATLDVYETTLLIPPNTPIEYLFVNGVGTKEVLDPAGACTNGNAQFTNRKATVATSSATYCNVWETCEACVPLSINNMQAQDLVVTVANGNMQILSTLHKKVDGLEVFDMLGRSIYRSSTHIATNTPIDINLQASGMFIVRIKQNNIYTTTKVLAAN